MAVPRPCITNVIATCRKNFSQWESSFLWKLRCHWLKFLRRVAKPLVIQGPGLELIWRQLLIVWHLICYCHCYCLLTSTATFARPITIIISLSIWPIYNIQMEYITSIVYCESVIVFFHLIASSCHSSVSPPWVFHFSWSLEALKMD